MFESAADNTKGIFDNRDQIAKNALRFNVPFLDAALTGIIPEDLVLFGAPSGVGKTQLCCNIATAALEDGKKVHYIALEAAHQEIERRLLFPLVFERYLSDDDRPKLHTKLNYADWYMGKFNKELKPYQDDALKYFNEGYKDLYLHYKQTNFTVSTLIETVCSVADHSDLIIVDHLHYFDFGDENENRGMKEIAKTVRDLVLNHGIPIVLIAHLRKKDRASKSLCADMEEFHGSSDIYKIATKVITMAPGRVTEDGKYETFFRIAKNRLDSGTTRYIAKEYFNPKSGAYETNKFQLGWANEAGKGKFELLAEQFLPHWAKTSSRNVGKDPVAFEKQCAFVTN